MIQLYKNLNFYVNLSLVSVKKVELLPNKKYIITMITYIIGT